MTGNRRLDFVCDVDHDADKGIFTVAVHGHVALWLNG